MQDSMFARAKRGDLPQDLSLEDITRLSSASLETPHGLCSNDDPLLLRLYRLVSADLLVPSRSEQVERPVRVLGSFGGQRIGTQVSMTTRHFVHAESLRPHVADLGAVGPLLLDWLGTPARKAPKTKGAGEPWHVVRVRDFCETVLSSGRIDPDHPEVTAGDIERAMHDLHLWHRTDGDLPSPDSRERYVRETAGKHFVLTAGRPKDCPDHAQRHQRAAAHLVALYRRAHPETMTLSLTATIEPPLTGI